MMSYDHHELETHDPHRLWHPSVSVRQGDDLRQWVFDSGMGATPRLLERAARKLRWSPWAVSST